MPYASIDELPDNIKKLSASKQRQWMHVWNSAHKRCTDKGGSSKSCESRAFAQANGVVLAAKHSAEFASWDAAYMNDLPDSAFLYVEPGGKKDKTGKTTPRSKRHLPYRDAAGKIDLAHLRNAISRLGQGKTLSGISDSLKATLQRKAQRLLNASHSGEVAEFAGGFDPIELAAPITDPIFVDDEEGIVYRPGLLFRAGDYPDKNFSLTPDELRAAVDAFDQAIPVDLQHESTVLDGMLGEVVSVECSEDGTELHGLVALPKWLDTVLPHRKVSSTWDRATKRMVGLALVRTPRVSDAALLSAFAWDQAEEADQTDEEHALNAVAALFAKRHDTNEGQSVIQALHDVSARGGAVCKRPKTAMSSSHEATAVQKVHDIASEHGAQCSEKTDNGRAFPYFGRRHKAPTNKEVTSMSKVEDLMRKLAAVFAEAEAADEGNGDGDGAPQPKPAEAPKKTAPMAADTAAFDAERTQMLARQNQLEAENARLRAERIQERAEAFATEQITKKRAFPPEHDSMVAIYVQMATDDVTLGPVKMSDGKTESRVDRLAAAYAARPEHLLDEETIRDGLYKLTAFGQTVKGAAPTGEGKPMSAERREALLRMTDLGSSVLAERTNGEGRR
jgi:cation transport regulator ChaB